VFNPISMRNVKAKIKVDPWSGVIGAKAELEVAWFRVRGIPYDKRSVKTLAYVGSLVGATIEVDQSSLYRTYYVRMKIAARDVSKIPEVAEGAILPFMYDFYFEREVEWGVALRKETSVQIKDPKEGNPQPSPKKPRVVEKAHVQSNLQMVIHNVHAATKETSNVKQKGNVGSQAIEESPAAHVKISSAPPKLMKSTLDKIFEDEDVNFKHKPYEKSSVEVSMSSSEAEGGADRVQGLFGSNFNISEDDFPSEEGQASQSNKQVVGMLKCSNPVMHKSYDSGYKIPDASPMTKVVPEENVLTIAELLSIGKMVNVKESGQPTSDDQGLECKDDSGIMEENVSISKA
jgi:hypothetical protein